MANLRVNKIAAVGVSTENTGSVFFDGTDDHLSIADSDDFSFGSGDFTIEGFIYGNSFGSYNGIVGQWPSDGGSANNSFVFEVVGGDLEFYYSVDSTLYGPIQGATVSTQEWHHVAAIRSGNTMYIFLDGIMFGSGDTSVTHTFNNPSSSLTVGGNIVGAGVWNGYISNLRICKGHAVYTENFTVPTRELEVHPETVLLCCHDGENIFADKSGRHIIAAYGDRLSSPTPTATDSPIGITTFNPGLTRNVDATAGPTFQGGAGFVSQNWLTLPKGTTEQRGGDRGLFGGGYDTGSSRTQTIEYINISTSGIALDFGDLIEQHADSTGNVASSTRGLFGGGANYPPTVYSDTIEHITMSSTGNGVDFGNLSAGRRHTGNLSNKTRGIFGPGQGDPSTTSQIDFVTIASFGNASDFGDMEKTTEPNQFYATLASPTRGIFAGGTKSPGVTLVNIIDYITISTLGDAQNFGDLLAAKRFVQGCSSQTRGIIAGGTTPSAYNNVIQYITISTLGDAQDFGDLSTGTVRDPHMTSNSIRGVFAGGEGAPTMWNTIEYVVIASTGNATDFGDLLDSRRSGPSASNSHGGLG